MLIHAGHQPPPPPPTISSWHILLKFLILNVATTVWFGFKLTFWFGFKLSKNISTFAWFIKILFTGFFSYFISRSLIRVIQSLRSIVTSELRSKSRPKIYWLDLSSFLTTRELIQSCLPRRMSFRPHRLPLVGHSQPDISRYQILGWPQPAWN